MIILVLNCGSSSAKYQVLDMKSEGNADVLAKGVVERIGLPEGVLTHKPAGKSEFERTAPIPDHTVAINMILEAIVDPEHGVIDSLSKIEAVGHRVAHGGEYFSDSVVVTPEVKKQIESCFELAPLHNPANMKGVEAVESLMPNVPQVTVFDTSFHQTMPKENYIYPIPYKYYEQYRIRRYGFHGTSHKYVAAKACKMAGLKLDESKIITCHIGNGASVTAIVNGKSFDTSMGFTPVDGLMMGTRCGSIDPSILTFIAEREELTADQMNSFINKKCGLQGLSEVSSDMRDVMAAADSGNEKAALALKIFNNRIKRFIGTYAAEMGGVDMIVFTGGIGEHTDVVRKGATEGLEFMGVTVDDEANKKAYGNDAVISAENSKVKVVVATTNEELVIASDTYRLLS